MLRWFKRQSTGVKTLTIAANRRAGRHWLHSRKPSNSSISGSLPSKRQPDTLATTPNALRRRPARPATVRTPQRSSNRASTSSAAARNSREPAAQPLRKALTDQMHGCPWTPHGVHGSNGVKASAEPAPQAPDRCGNDRKCGLSSVDALAQLAQFNFDRPAGEVRLRCLSDERRASRAEALGLAPEPLPGVGAEADRRRVQSRRQRRAAQPCRDEAPARSSASARASTSEGRTPRPRATFNRTL